MRLWSLHPKYLDPQGLVALWREALLAQAVLHGETRGYKKHPQLLRFLKSSSPTACIAEYLREVHSEGIKRGYKFDGRKIRCGAPCRLKIPVTTGQLEYELALLRKKLSVRNPQWVLLLRDVNIPDPHPLFCTVEGDIEDWEKPKDLTQSPCAELL